MARLTLYCKKCWSGHETDGEVPLVCPICDRETEWTATFQADAPKVPFELTSNDRRFLRSLHIDTES